VRNSRGKAVLIATFLGLFAVFSVLLKNELRKEKSPLALLPLGHPMPDFTLQDTRGSDYSIGKIAPQKKLVLINFWATWCTPCRLEMPNLEKLYEKNSGEGLLILAVNEDRDPGKLSAYLKEKPVGFPVLVDHDGALAERLGIRAFPTTILVPADGKIMAVVEGLDQYMAFRVEAELHKNEQRKVKKADASVTITTHEISVKQK
jgi:thiol-disulfide isomerase/thioredoxin